MNYSEIKKTDIANGVGVRVSLFVSGCRNHCEGCFQPETWDFNFGNPFTAETENEIVKALRPSWIQGLSILGGEPMGKIWANVYMTDEIVIINPKDGRVEGVIDCRGLLPNHLRTPMTDVLNGIAYDAWSEKIYLTGKNWPELYEVRLVEK